MAEWLGKVATSCCNCPQAKQPYQNRAQNSILQHNQVIVGIGVVHFIVVCVMCGAYGVSRHTH
jgi:hypothetical protein